MICNKVLSRDEYFEVVHKARDFVSQSKLVEFDERTKTYDPHVLVGPGFLLVEAIKEGPKGGVYRALDCTNLGAASFCVVKKARKGSGRDPFGRDAASRLQHESKVLQELVGKVQVPRVLASFGTPLVHYLAQEHIPLRPLSNLRMHPWSRATGLERRFIAAVFRNATFQVERLHRAGLVHRDLSPGNILFFRDQHAVLLDFELAYKLSGEYPHFQGGTQGIRSPQQSWNCVPAASDDVYSIAANFLAVLLGIRSKVLLVDCFDARKLEAACCFTGIKATQIRTLLAAVKTDASQRPSVEELQNAFGDLHTSISRAELRRLDVRPVAPVFGGRRWRATLSECLTAFCQEVNDSNLEHASERPPAWLVSADLADGTAGALYMLSRAVLCGYSSHGVLSAGDKLCQRLRKVACTKRGLYDGVDGIKLAVQLWLAVTATKPDVIPSWTHEKSTAKQTCDLAHGWAGVGLMHLQMHRLYAQREDLEAAQLCADRVAGNRPDGPDRDQLLGASLEDSSFSDGLAGRVYFLSHYGSRARTQEAVKNAATAADTLVSRARYLLDRRFLAWPVSSAKVVYDPWLTSGNAGVALALLSVTELTGVPTYSKLAIRALEVTPAYVNEVDLSLASGISGLGEVYLEASRILGTPSWQARAEALGDMVCELAQPALLPTPWSDDKNQGKDFGMLSGCSGILHFLMRLVHPNTISFPLGA